ncbi:MAG TPA: hypothetical protein VN043_03670 [Rhodanobacter sp.]|nr:hypothetical protein [Rhodanobacter sp.]
MATLAIIGLLCAGLAHAADQTIVAKGRCQMTVPANWKADSLLKTEVTAPDKSASAVLSSPNPSFTLAEVKPMVQASLKPVKSIEDSAQRLWYAYETSYGQGTGWYVGVPGKNGHICAAQISFKSAPEEALAKKIALSIKPMP